MYAIPEALTPSPPGLGSSITVGVRSRLSASQRGGRSPRREQPAHQLGALPEALLLGRLRGFTRRPRLWSAGAVLCSGLRGGGAIGCRRSRGRPSTAAVFQLAEVAVPRQMFAEILSLIALLRAPPASARGAFGI
jgi:hypothetical protein